MVKTQKPKKRMSDTALMMVLIGEMLLLLAAVVGVLYWLGFIKF